MAALCSTSEHCESEIREKLSRAGLESGDIERIIDHLVDECFIDASRYCHAYARDKLRFAHWGRVKIAYGLRAKGLPEADIEEAIADLPEDEYTEVLNNLIQQKARSLRSETPYVRNGKIARFALSHGFTYQDLSPLLDD